MLVLEYQSGYIEKILREVEDFLKVTFLSTPTNQRTQHDYDGIDQDENSTNQKGIAAIMLPPLLVMVGYGDPSDSRAFLILSQFISQVYQIIERFFKHHQDHRMWFIQPFYSFSEEGNLKQGIFAGMNWLIRKLMKQNECRMHN